MLCASLKCCGTNICGLLQLLTSKPTGVALVGNSYSLFEMSDLVSVNCKEEPAKNVAYQTV